MFVSLVSAEWANGLHPFSFQEAQAFMKIKHTEEGLLSGFQTKDFRLECGESTPRVVRMVFCPDWSSGLGSSPKIQQNNLNLLPVINARQDHLPPRPLLVIDKDGGSAAPAFCALSNLFRQVHYDHSVDIYLTAKTIHNCRPGVWTRPDHILALYKAVELFISGNTKKTSGECFPFSCSF